MIVRTNEERERLLEAGRRFGAILETLAGEVRPGVTTAALDARAEELIRTGGDDPVFKGYQPEGTRTAFPAALCISVNDEVVHGIPGARTLKEGDIVSLDLGLSHEGMIVDSAVTVPVGKTDANSYKLMDVTRAALDAGIAAARPGNRIGDISHAIEEAYAGSGFSIVRILGGHGVGAFVHEEPFIGNLGHPGTGPEILPGMVLALEPIANLGRAGVHLLPNGHTFATKDGSRSAHFEHTILVEEGGTIVVTKRPSEA
ncbi:MAG TPA: type I methionyl aminopeptidase [Candidatus Paceibacterota bacterium]|jgi:methionyl aminopeptidase|nr:type I methionyl aminopeptidase [Candidatus Paceibacterota bacterium]